MLRNIWFNFIGNAIPLAVGLATMPMTIRGLGIDAFGVLAFAWAILGYFTLFDFGLSRATTKFVAASIGRREVERVPDLVWPSLTLSVALGVAGACLLAAAAPLLAARGLRIPPSLVGDTRVTFLLLAAALPAVVVSNTLRGVLEADQRFGLVNAVKAPASAAMFALPAIGVLVGLQLPGIVVLLVLSRFATVVAYGWLCVEIFPDLRRPRLRLGGAPVRPLVAYGGWVTVSNIVGPILTYLDRFLIGVLISSAAVAYYAAPYEIVTRLWIFPTSVVVALFPAFSSTAARDGHGAIGRFFGPSIKYLLLVLGAIVVVLVLFARQILAGWLGAEFATRSTVVFQVLSIGVLINSLAQVPFSLLQALGRADLPAKFYLAELAFYVLLAWMLIARFGIAGAAWAWTIRVLLDALLHFAAAWKLYPASWMAFRRDGAARGLVAVGVLAAAGAAMMKMLAVQHPAVQASAMAALLAIFSLMVWRWVLDAADRERLAGVLGDSMPSI